MKKVLFILILLLIGVMLIGKTVTQTVPLPDLAKPHFLAADENQIYIAEKATVYIYSTKNFKFIKKFGKQGEGPGEFKGRAARVIIQPDHLFINCVGKISYFTKDGKFIKELKTMAPDMRVKPFGDLFVAARTLMENGIFYVPVNLYDSNLKLIKEVYRVKRGVQMGGKGTTIFAHPLPYYTVEDKLFIAKEKDLVIEVLGKNGEKLYSITYDYKKVKVSGADKEEVLEHIKTDPNTKPYLEMIKPIIFPDYYPVIRTYYIADKEVYVFTYKKENDKTECLIFDIKGKFLKQVFLPYVYKDPIDEYPAAIKNGKLYQLIDNDETENWELHITGMDLGSLRSQGGDG